ncbi:MAG: response regulator [Nitrospirota bacterium]|nr:response regulator [Nitrospirota bacterium]MDH5767459.1 response regulator [Nitrospirota bacterium]
MFGFIKRRLGYKIMAAMVITIAVISISEITFRIYFGTKDRLELMTMAAKELASSTYAGIKYPMSIGDSEAIKRQLSDIREKAKEVEVFITDFDQEIIYSTHEDKVKTRLADSISNKDTKKALSVVLATGADPNRSFDDTVSGVRYHVMIFPILNQKDCYHCHGSQRHVLGSMAVRVSAEQVYKTVAAQRNRTLLLLGFTLPIAITIIFLLVNRLVRRPIENLAEKAKSFAEGDMSVSVDVKTEDEIGVLGKTFNYMVESVSSFSRKLEMEVTRKTTLLNERTHLLSLLERANRELRELDKLKSTFLANMSHELRTPMNAIIGYTELLIDRVDGPINEEQEKSLKKVVANAKHLLQLINDVLDVSKIEAGKIELEAKELDLKWLIDSVIPTFEPQIKQKGLTLTINLEENLSHIYGDEDKVRQILINLLSNAVKFTHKGGIMITAKLSERGIKPQEQHIFVEVCIEDTGIGIKEEDIGKIFDKFTQADLSTIRQYEGTGLGLSIARGLVALHKGVIWATSKYGEGSKFCFTIPLKKEIFEKPYEPIVELKMAEGLSEYFGRPVETFLKKPEYAGKPIRCWEYTRCGQPSCPAYGSKETRCWLILGTHCSGMKVAAYPEKLDFCKGCEVIERLILETKEYKPEEAELLKEGAKNIILAIDDNPEAIDIIRKYLGEDYRVIGLISSEEAVEKAKELKPLAITLDIMMPKKDGWQVLRELKKTPETQDIPVIILSIVDNKRLGFSLGAAEYIVKPVEKQVLLRKLRNLEKTTTIKRILVVDNDPDTVKLISNVLKEAGYKVTIAYNSKDAIDSIEDFEPDLIVLNLTMPEVSGFDVIEYLKTEERAKDIPLIIVTHKDLTENEIDELNGRIQGILNKGILTKEDLLNELKDTITKVSKAQ